MDKKEVLKRIQETKALQDHIKKEVKTANQNLMTYLDQNTNLGDKRKKELLKSNVRDSKHVSAFSHQLNQTDKNGRNTSNVVKSAAQLDELKVEDYATRNKQVNRSALNTFKIKRLQSQKISCNSSSNPRRYILSVNNLSSTEEDQPLNSEQSRENFS